MSLGTLCRYIQHGSGFPATLKIARLWPAGGSGSNPLLLYLVKEDNLATKAIKLNYLSAERFFKDYERLCTGKIFLPTSTPLPLKTRISLNIIVPDIEEVLTVEGGVVKTIDEQTAAQLQKPVGMLVGLIGGAEVALKNLNRTLSENTYYRMLLNLPAASEEDQGAAPASGPQEESEPASQITDTAAEQVPPRASFG